jgi:hypothetical protein
MFLFSFDKEGKYSQLEVSAKLGNELVNLPNLTCARRGRRGTPRSRRAGRRTWRPWPGRPGACWTRRSSLLTAGVESDENVSECFGNERAICAASNVAAFSVVDCLFKQRIQDLMDEATASPPCTARTHAARRARRANHARAPHHTSLQTKHELHYST